jgi:hypothetical protein
MPQTSTIAFALVIGFVVYITVRGQLPGYLGVLGLGSQPVNGPVQQSGGTAIGNALKSAGNAANAIGSLPSLFGGG